MCILELAIYFILLQVCTRYTRKSHIPPKEKSVPLPRSCSWFVQQARLLTIRTYKTIRDPITKFSLSTNCFPLPIDLKTPLPRSQHRFYVFGHITMKLGVYLDYNNGRYECTICERFFNHEAALYDHCRQTSRHAWCERCSRVFLSGSAKDTHLRESNAHHICSNCPRLQDFKTDKELEDHLVEYHHYCPNYNIYCNSEKELEEHDVVKHYLCPKCGEFFGNEDNLQMIQ